MDAMSNAMATENGSPQSTDIYPNTSNDTMTLYGWMSKDRMQSSCEFGKIWPDRKNMYTGLRQSPDAAIERAQTMSNWNLQPGDGIIFKVTVSLRGWMHVTTTMRGSVPLVQRMTYGDGIDYGVWHFNDTISLSSTSTSGDMHYEVTFHPTV